MGHGFNTHGNGGIGLPAGHHHTGVTKCNSPRRTSALHLGASNGGQAQTMTHNASQHLFAVQGATDEVAQVKRANQLSLNR